MDVPVTDWRFTASRLTTWMLPMLVLIESFPRPQIGWKSELFTVVHLLGDPISTIEDLLQRLQRRKLNYRFYESFPVKDDRIEWKRKNLKSIALIVDAYDEFGKGHSAREILLSLFNLSSNLNTRELKLLQREIDFASYELGPTWPLSIITAASFYVGALLLEWFTQPDISELEALRAREDIIALSLMFSWLPGAVLFSSTFRQSSTRWNVYGILQGFHKHLIELIPTSDTNSLEFAFNEPSPMSLLTPASFWSSGVAFLIVSAGAVPVHLFFGHSPFAAILEPWVNSFLLGLLITTFAPKFGHKSLMFPLMFLKDLYTVLLTSYVFIMPICLQNSAFLSQHWVSKLTRVSYLNALFYLSIAVVLGGITLTNHSTPFEIARNVYSTMRQSRSTELVSESDDAHAYIPIPPQSEDTVHKFRNTFAHTHSSEDSVTTGFDERHTKVAVSNYSPKELHGRHVDCTLISNLVQEAEYKHRKPIVQLFRDFHIIISFHLCRLPTALLSPESQSILETFKSSCAKTGNVSPPSTDLSLFIRTMNDLMVSQSNKTFDGVFGPQAMINRIIRPPVPRGKVRLTWRCKCNASMYGDFEDSDGKEIDHLAHELGSDDYPHFNVREIWVPLLGAYTALNNFKETDTVFLGQLRPIIEEVNKCGALIGGIERSSPGSAAVSVLPPASNAGASSKAKTNSKAIGSINPPSQRLPTNAASNAESGTPAAVNQPIKKFIALCVNTQQNFISLGESDVSTAGSDSEVFRKFQDVYSSLRSKRYAAFKKWLIQPVDMKFIQFTVEDSHRVDVCHDPPFIPPESEVQAKRYEYNPCPLVSMPPIPASAFLHYLSCTAPLRGTKWLNRLPKKLQTKLQDVRRSTQLEEDVRGWGILIIEGPNKVAMTWLTGIVVTLSGVLSVVYAVLKNDVSGGFAIGAYVIAFWVAWMTAFYFQWKE